MKTTAIKRQVSALRVGTVWLILLILLVQLFQTVGTRLAVKCDKRLKK